MTRRRKRMFYVSWTDDYGQRQTVVGEFMAIERICDRLKRRGAEHRWGVVRRV